MLSKLECYFRIAFEIKLKVVKGLIFKCFIVALGYRWQSIIGTPKTVQNASNFRISLIES